MKKLTPFIQKVLSIVFIVIVVGFVSFGVILYYDIEAKKSTYHAYEISGHINELKLVTTFPNEGLYIGFDNGEYRFVDINYWWSYANLQLIHPNNNVTLTYERNYYGHTRLLHIQEVEI